MILDAGNYGAAAQDIYYQPDGKIIIAGYRYINNANPVDGVFELIRLNSDGSLDQDFSGGRVTTDFTSYADIASKVSVQSDGKIVVAGYTASSRDIVLARYNVDGSLDSNFGINGKVTADFQFDSELINSLVLQSDGKIVVAGFQGNYVDNNYLLARFNPDGSLDSSFGNAGKVITDFENDNDSISDIIIQQDGRLLVVGNATINGISQVTVSRYNADGSPDPSFDPYYTVDNQPVVSEQAWVNLDQSVQIYDADFHASGSYAGTSVTLSRHGGVCVDDQFSGSGLLSSLIEGSAIVYNGNIIGGVEKNSAGVLKLNFNTVRSTESIVNAALSAISYRNNSDTPPNNIQIDWLVSDGYLTGSAYSTISILPVNDLPTGLNANTSLLLNNSYEFSLQDFAFSDPEDGLSFTSIRIDSLPTLGNIYFNGYLLSSTGMDIDQSDITSGSLIYTAPFGSSGSFSAQFTFSVKDSNNAYSSLPYTFTVNIIGNDSPTGSVTITGTPTQGQILTAANTLADLDGLGTIAYQWKADGTNISNATSSTFTLTQSQVGKAITVVASYTDQLSTVESVASGATSRVSALNNIPASIDVLATTKEDTVLALTSSLFSFSDADKADKLQSVTISTLPSQGTLLLNGASVSADQSISIADINAKRLVYTPSSNGNGNSFDALNFKVSDGKDLSNSAVMTFNVTAVNDAPTVANLIANQNATEGSAFNFILPSNIFSDVDGGTLTYKATLANGKALPKWLAFNASSLTFTGMPADADSATTLSIQVVATDSGKLFTSDIFDLVITGVNVAPVGKTLAAVTATEGKLFTYNLPKATFTDGDKGDVLTYSSTNLPSWLTINSATGKITGTPDYIAADSDYTTVSITATDRDGLSDTEDLRINLINSPVITGTALANTLTGGNGADTIKGGAGDDALTGGTGNDILWGEVGNDILLGGIGLDTLIGGLGNDRLTGGEGNDIFLFNTAIGVQNIDTITDFTSGDKIQLSQSIFKDLTKGAVTEAQFYLGTAAHDATDRVIYDQSTGALFYDVDGTGAKAAVQIAIIGSAEHSVLQASDLWVV